MLSFLWNKFLGSPFYEVVTDITMGNDGSIFLTGNTYGDLVGQSNNRLYYSDAFISKFNLDGEIQWTSVYDNELGYSDYSSAIATSADDSIFICGITSGTIRRSSSAAGNFIGDWYTSEVEAK